MSNLWESVSRMTRLQPEIHQLRSMLSMAELDIRPSRPPDYEAESRALVALSRELATSPGNILQKLAETALTLCQRAFGRA